MIEPNYVTQYTQKTLGLCERLVATSASCFYFVNNERGPFGHSLRNMLEETLPAYTQEFEHIDPFHPKNFAQTDKLIVTGEDVHRHWDPSDDSYFREFMIPQGVHYEMEVFLRDGSQIVAGISLLRSKDIGPFSSEDRCRLESVHDYIQYALNSHILPKKDSETDLLVRQYNLSPRQIEVVRLLREGASNKKLSAHLGISLPTVKTHISQIFEKVGVRSRTDLLSKLYLGKHEVLEHITL
ncbi:monoamine regulon transcriptional regulator [Luminiphilus syltensis NOR5-1B]|uniref:Monoamine regulon transcriptional regulator n=1 Tax=Luminiphilus syltensis NOR5-1B TaxID=565045 RepID=B8KY03_9GAMM|nr:LuxR C-terminal-related transcriptional regulator [Luminiphilus syltensis]EED35299.1 monoamine regulon transcriptional regulator [Luminiphilus syltensis NOR5-1B]